MTVPYIPSKATDCLRGIFKGTKWRENPRQAFLQAFAALKIPTGEIGEGIQWTFLGSEEDPIGAFACVRDPDAPTPLENERKSIQFFFRLAEEMANLSRRSLHREREEEEQEYLLEAMNQVGQLMLERPNRARLFPSLLKIVLDVARTEVGSLLLDTEGQFITEVEWGLPGELLEGIRFPPEERGIIEVIQRTLEPVVVDDFSGPTVQLPAGFPVRITSLVSIPLLVGDRLIGILNVASGEEGREILPSTIKALVTIAGLIATAVENAYLRESLAACAREAHQDLAEEQSLIRQVMSNLGDGILISDLEGRIVFANRSAEEMLSLSGAGGQHFPDRNIIGLRLFFTWLRGCWATHPNGGEFEYVLGLNPQETLLVKIFPLKKTAGRFSRMTVLRKSSQLSSWAEARSRTMRTAREMETPLAAIQTALAVKSQGDQNNNKLTDSLVARGIDRLCALTEDLRDQALLDQDLLKLNLSEVSLNDVLCEALVPIQGEIQEKKIAYRRPNQDCEVPVLADRDRITRAFHRFLAAVVRWVPEEGWMSVEVARKEESAEVSIHFQQGPESLGFEGIFASSAEGEEKLNSPDPPGTTGLLVASRIVGLHGGQLNAKSEGDLEGSFLFELPVHDAIPEEEKDQQEKVNDFGTQFSIAIS